MSLATLKGGIEMGRKKKAKEVETMVEPEIEETIEEVVEPEVEETIEEVIEPEIEETIEKVEETIEEVNEIKGKVSANKLYLRSGPSKEANPSKILDINTEVLIDSEFNDETFYKVILNDGTEGYCVKEFIKI